LTQDTRAAPVTVVVPCYNCGATIERAIDSIRAQTRLPQQVILVDDASRDGTHELLDRLQRESAGWIEVVLLDRNRGPAVARNAGWERAKGEFVAFLDADDAWHPEKIQRQFSFLRDHPEVAVCGHAHIQCSGASAWPELPRTDAWHRVTLAALLIANRFITPSVMIRREVPLRFDESRRYMEDHLLWMQAAADGLGVARLAAPLAAIFKAPVGAAGLSSHLLRMSAADLSNYWHLRRQNRISLPQAILCSLWSTVKFMRRMLFIALARLAPKPHESRTEIKADEDGRRSRCGPEGT
jgi:glycosyltransferase involved in cell wall biosynthesis